MREPAVSLALSGLAFLLLYAVSGAPLAWTVDPLTAGAILASAVLASVLAAASAIDLRTYRLPDALTIPLLVAGLFVSWCLALAPLWWRAASAAVGYGLLALVGLAYHKLRERAGLGLGDAKLLAAAGAWVGAEGLPTILLWASGSALIGVTVAYFRGSDLKAGTRIPFGPFIAFGTWLVWLYGPL